MKIEGFFDDKEVTNKGQGEKWFKSDPIDFGTKWLKSERDKALDEYFEGAHPRQLGIKYKGSPRAFTESILKKLKYNSKRDPNESGPGRAEKYVPFDRRNRLGARWTPNEIDFLKAHRQRKIVLQVTATILCREVKELDIELDTFYSEMVRVTASADLLQAHQFLYHCFKAPIISNEDYDLLKKKLGVHDHSDSSPQQKVVEYSPHIRSLGYYLAEKHLEEKRSLKQIKRDAL